MKGKGALIAYQLRPHKAIDRSLFLTVLKKIDRYPGIDLQSFRYVGFGAAFLEDFKVLHSEFGITKMDSVEVDELPFSRQQFNNPYHFIKLFNESSTEYIRDHFKSNLNQIFWWDFSSPKELRDQLKDIELTSGKLKRFDILKFTFVADSMQFGRAFKDAKHSSDATKPFKLLKDNILLGKVTKDFLNDDPTFKLYTPPEVTAENIEDEFPGVLRVLGIRAAFRGLLSNNRNLTYLPICSFTYRDGMLMLTVTGIVLRRNELNTFLTLSGINEWDFFDDATDSVIKPTHIEVPVMTSTERSEIDKHIHHHIPTVLAKKLKFYYGNDMSEHLEYIKGYHRFYKYLPFYSKVIT